MFFLSFCVSVMCEFVSVSEFGYLEYDAFAKFFMCILSSLFLPTDSHGSTNLVCRICQLFKILTVIGVSFVYCK